MKSDFERNFFYHITNAPPFQACAMLFNPLFRQLLEFTKAVSDRRHARQQGLLESKFRWWRDISSPLLKRLVSAYAKVMHKLMSSARVHSK